ncbi:urea transporter [Metabacillus fastidiosus]|uniref:urea transporter n=1 Tax=Metabacillus fastidiosus TaxID=1458 RepID=UPI003D282D45
MQIGKKISINQNFLSLILATFRGISQVILIENALSGFIILLAITISSYQLGIIAVLSSLIGTIVAKIGGADEVKVNQGLFGYNSVLTGIALALFLNGPYQWIIVLIGAGIASIVTATIMHIMRNSGLPILTFPFIILTWFMLLIPYYLDAFKLSSELIPQDLASRQLNRLGTINWTEGIFSGIGQIFFLDSMLPSILIFIAIFLFNIRTGIYAVLGNLTAVIIAFFLGAEPHLISIGLYGYNAILTILAVSIVFNDKKHPLTIFGGIFAACLSVLITASISSLLVPYGLPILTMPFVLCSWMFLSAKKILHKL